MKHNIEVLDEYSVTGWAVDKSQKEFLTIRVFDGKQCIAECTADIDRPDLVKTGTSLKGGGFRALFSHWVPTERLGQLTVVAGNQNTPLRIPAKSLAQSKIEKQDRLLNPLGKLDEPLIPKTRSRFGGLWTDKDDAKSVIDGQNSMGWITDQESELLHHWVDYGYVVIKNAIEPHLIDGVLEEWDHAWGRNDKGIWVEAFKEGKKIFAPAKEEYKAAQVKLLDLYSVSDNARKVSLHSRITRFLSLVFQRPPLAFQSLSFMQGTQQPVHQDTAYVKVSSPLELAASWVALEDIQPGTGELEYYPGSHMFTDFLWSGNSKWKLASDSAEQKRFLDSLHEKAKQHKLEITRFLPKKGDVLIWSADLAHGGSKTTSQHTRKSLVTHYCPVSCNPFYFYTARHSDKIKFEDAYYAFEKRGAR